MGWTPWFAVRGRVLSCLSFEPMRETFPFRQVNTLLLAMVAADLLFGWRAARRAGVGIGLATAIKLTPGIFILYLLVTGRWRAAAPAMRHGHGRDAGAAAMVPDASREFWTSALWDTDRVGSLSYVSNQSLRGLIARLPVDTSSRRLDRLRGGRAGGLGVAGRAAGRLRRTRPHRHRGLPDQPGHLGAPLVWLLPALVRCVDAGLSGRDRRTALYLASPRRPTCADDRRGCCGCGRTTRARRWSYSARTSTSTSAWRSCSQRRCVSRPKRVPVPVVDTG